ncbi:hypothetical protein OUZ56_029526 [Daphnia magna]|uniref:Uncharacterized protein n=1 Tax=Daphnia magna TaxID=35525 RepID=A0ABR0B727_9CRUS|nr:hypothetical protein OUZ56_029526 [Daphnia magna]
MSSTLVGWGGILGKDGTNSEKAVVQNDTINTRPLTFVSEDDNEPLTPKQLISEYGQRQKHTIDEEEIEYSDRVTLIKREKKLRNRLATC